MTRQLSIYTSITTCKIPYRALSVSFSDEDNGRERGKPKPVARPEAAAGEDVVQQAALAVDRLHRHLARLVRVQAHAVQHQQLRAEPGRW